VAHEFASKLNTPKFTSKLSASVIREKSLNNHKFHYIYIFSILYISITTNIQNLTKIKHLCCAIMQMKYTCIHEW